MSTDYLKRWRLNARLEEEFLSSDNDQEMETCDNNQDFQESSELSAHEETDADEEDLIVTNSGNSSSSDEFDLIREDVPPFSEQLRDWACRNKCTRTQLSELLLILRNNGHCDVPRDPRTLLQTPREVPSEPKCGGQYLYLGIKKGIIRCLQDFPHYTSQTIKLVVNTDGIPLFKSTGLDLWPILGMFVYPHPFVISLYVGQGKPNSCNEYLEDFLDEYRQLEENGFMIEGHHYSVKIWCFTCDAPARQFIKCIKGHGGFFACERCVIEGERIDHRTVFLSSDNDLRSDEDFDNFRYEGDHQHALSPVVGSVQCIRQFPLDYMHLVCLGVMKRLLQFWKDGPRVCKLSQGQLNSISQKLQSYRGSMPSEFNRQPRGLDQLSRFKATEFRSFLLYYGCIVVMDELQEPVYKHFLSLVVALRILLDENDNFRNEHLDYAQKLLLFFSDNAATHYSPSFTVYNVHSLIHLTDDSRNFNVNLDQISCFPFENQLQILKKLVRNSTNSLASVFKRISELESAGIKSSYKCIKTKVSKIPRDSWFLLKNGNVVCVKQVQSKTTFLCNVYKQHQLLDFFDEPCHSSFVDIFLLRSQTKNTQKSIDKSLLKRKMVSLAVENGIVLIAVLNDVKFSD